MKSISAESELEILTGHARDVVIVVNRDGEITYISPAGRAYGATVESMRGQPLTHLLHPDDRARADANTARMLRGAPPAPYFERQYRCRTESGDWAWLEGHTSPVRDDQGVITSIVCVLRDVTEQREQADLFEAAFQEAATGIALMSPDGRIVRANSAMCEMLGHSAEVARTLTPKQLVHPDDLNLDMELGRRLAKGEIDNYSIEKRHVRSDGAVVPTLTKVAAIRSPDGSPKYYLIQLHDLTEQHAAMAALEKSEERYRLVAENTSDIILTVDLNGRITFINTTATRSGHRMRDLLGGSPMQAVHPDDAEMVWKSFKRLHDGEACDRIRWRGLNKATGEWVWVESAPTLLRDPETNAPTGFLDVVRDIHQQVVHDEELATARAEAEQAAAAKAQFLANMSHEIRTPLTAILGFTGLLSEAQELGDAARTYVDRISKAGSALLAIVNDVLDLSKLEAGKIDIRPRATDIDALAEETLELFGFDARAKGLGLTFERDPDAPTTVLLDPDRLRQILINLVGNAVKFTERGGVHLAISEGEQPNTLRFAVTDTGPGLDEAQRQRLFQRFSQVDGSNTRRHGGTGLGLAICRGLAEAMGGDVGVDSTPDVGSTFHVTLPAKEVQASPAVASDELSYPTLDDVRVLVVDDNSANREIAGGILVALNAEVTEAETGDQALDLLSIQPVDVVLLDLKMAGVDGREVLLRLRQTPGPNQDVPVVAFTAETETELTDGFDGIVGKPFTPRQLATAIYNAIHQLGSNAGGAANAA